MDFISCVLDDYGTCQRLFTHFRKNPCFQLRIICVICPHESAVKYADIFSADNFRILYVRTYVSLRTYIRK